MVGPDLVSSVMSVLTPYVVKGAGKFAEEAGKAAFEKTRALFETLRKRWSGDKEASSTLDLFAEKPSRYEQALRSILDEKVTEDPTLRSELTKLLQAMGPELDVIQKIKIGKGVTGLKAEEMVSGHARVQQDIEEAENATAVDIKKIG